MEVHRHRRTLFILILFHTTADLFRFRRIGGFLRRHQESTRARACTDLHAPVDDPISGGWTESTRNYDYRLYH